MEPGALRTELLPEGADDVVERDIAGSMEEEVVEVMEEAEEEVDEEEEEEVEGQVLVEGEEEEEAEDEEEEEVVVEENVVAEEEEEEEAEELEEAEEVEVEEEEEEAEEEAEAEEEEVVAGEGEREEEAEAEEEEAEVEEEEEEVEEERKEAEEEEVEEEVEEEEDHQAEEEVAGEGDVEEEEAEEAEQEAVEEAGEGAGHEEEEVEEEVEDDGNGSGGTAGGQADPVMHRARTSKFKGVYWVKNRGKWAARYKGKFLGNYVMEEAAAQACEEYAKDGGDPAKRREGTSSAFKGVSWNKCRGQWQAYCKKKRLGCYATEGAAARAYDDYITDGVVPTKRRAGTSREGTSQFKGVSWRQSMGKWTAECNRKHLGYHATEAAAARAYNIEAGRIGRADLNVIAPADDADDDAPAALALLTLAALSALTHVHAGAGSKGSKRAGALTTPVGRYSLTVSDPR